MGSILAFLMPAILILVLFFYLRRNKFRHRIKLIDSYRFPNRLNEAIKKRYPHLTEQDVDRVIIGLREYFQISLMARKRMVAMPSQVVDLAWHEFILFTRHYEAFCKHALGRFLHHTPAEAMRSPTDAQEGIKRAWRLSCQREGIDPHKPNRLPLLFALDSELKIEDGFNYKLDCKALKDNGYCASHIGCGGGCSGGCGGDSSSDSGCGGGCGGD